MDPNVPLECQDTGAFGKFDQEQLDILKHDALDLILLENAGELLRRVMMKKDSIEKMLMVLSKSSRGCSVLDSETFPWWTPSVKKGSEETFNDRLVSVKKQADELKRGNPNGCITGIFAVEVRGDDKDDAVGHYCAIFYSIKNKKAQVFDSMQASASRSDFTPFFVYLAGRIFPNASIEVPECFTTKLSLQPTGGFSFHEPLAFKLLNKTSFAKTQIDEINGLRLMSTESQNHFCYMWSTWYLHHLMMGLKIEDTLKEIEESHTDPLLVIKRYAWGILVHPEMRLIDAMDKKYHAFFARNFPSIWTNDPKRTLKLDVGPDYVVAQKFERYGFPVQTPKTVSDILVNSIRFPVQLTLEAKTVMPDKLRNKCLGKVKPMDVGAAPKGRERRIPQRYRESP